MGSLTKPQDMLIEEKAMRRFISSEFRELRWEKTSAELGSPILAAPGGMDESTNRLVHRSQAGRKALGITIFSLWFQGLK